MAKRGLSHSILDDINTILGIKNNNISNVIDEEIDYNINQHNELFINSNTSSKVNIDDVNCDDEDISRSVFIPPSQPASVLDILTNTSHSISPIHPTNEIEKFDKSIISISPHKKNKLINEEKIENNNPIILETEDIDSDNDTTLAPTISNYKKSANSAKFTPVKADFAAIAAKEKIYSSLAHEKLSLIVTQPNSKTSSPLIKGFSSSTPHIGPITAKSFVDIPRPISSQCNLSFQFPLVRLCTFNVENLFARFDFSKDRTKDVYSSNGFTLNDLAFGVFDEQEKMLTGKCIKATQADIICLQEIESCVLLDRFRNKFLNQQGYQYTFVVESHDPRFINVGIMSRYPIIHVRSHKDELNKDGNAFLFSRDCLEVDIQVGPCVLTVYINHLRAMTRGRQPTHARRFKQATRIVEIVRERWEKDDYEGNFVVCGDMNDYNDEDTALTPLLRAPFLENVVERMPKEDQWTHYYNKEDKYSQLDYLFISKSLGQHPANRESIPIIERRGMPMRAKYDQPRFPGVGYNSPKASDHCPVLIDLFLLPPNYKKNHEIDINSIKAKEVARRKKKLDHLGDSIGGYEDDITGCSKKAWETPPLSPRI